MKNQSIRLYVCFLFLTFSLSGLANDLSLADILNLDVTTASKSKESITQSSSIMSVITENEIKLSGARTIYEVLQRVPGFFPTSQATWTMVGSRGLVSHGSDHVLLLIDGHSQNSILEQGYQQQDMIPGLEHIARIEIIRGPGSVLWGSSAAMGIINIITKDSLGGEGDESHVNFGASSADTMLSNSYLQGINSDGVKGIMSFKHWQSNGYNDPDKPNIRFPWGAEENEWPNLDKHNYSYEIYSKIKVGNKHEFKARLLDMSITYPWDSWRYSGYENKPGSELRTRKAYIDYTYEKNINSNFKVSHNFHMGMTLQLRHPLEIEGDAEDTRWIEDLTQEESGLGYEFSGQYSTNKNLLNFGFKYTRTDVGPNRSNRFDTSTNLPTEPTGSEEQVNVIGVKPGVDNNASIYIQDKYAFSDTLNLFLGLRADKNDYRENSTVLLPRTGVIKNLSKNLTAKYIFNTGYLRPNAVYSKNGGKFYRAPSKTIEDVTRVDGSEKVYSHDIQFFWAKENQHFAVTFFHTTIENFISWETKTDLGYRTIGDAITKGFELEGRKDLNNKVSVYGNYSYAKAELLGEVPTVKVSTTVDPSGEASLENALTDGAGHWLNYPHHIFNLGINYYISADKALNVNLRGWRDMLVVGSYEDTDLNQLEGEEYLDLNFRLNNFASGELSTFVTNVFNNIDPIGTVVNNGLYSPRGRSLGVLYTYKF